MEHNPTYPARFAKARTQWGDALRDRAHALAVDGAAEMVLHNVARLSLKARSSIASNTTLR
jgi:hypothetical protein